MSVESFVDTRIPGWKVDATQLKNKHFDLSELYEEQFVYNGNEVGMKNPTNDSHIKIFNNGNIEMYTGDTTGIIINDKYDTVSVHGDGFNVNTEYLNISTNPNGFRWNGHILNPQLYQLLNDDLLLEGSVRHWAPATENQPAHWERRSVQLKAFIKIPKDDEYDAILSEVGIPI